MLYREQKSFHLVPLFTISVFINYVDRRWKEKKETDNEQLSTKTLLANGRPVVIVYPKFIWTYLTPVNWANVQLNITYIFELAMYPM